MAHQWEAEKTVDNETAFNLIQEQFPEINIQKLSFLGAGWDNTAFIVNEHLIFRFPRREISVPFLEKEWQALPKLQNFLPLPIPIPKWRGSPTEKFSWPFVGYQMLPGTTACHANLSEDQREALAVPIAEFLKKLHEAPPTVLSQCQILNDNYARIDREKIIPKALKNLNDLASLGLIEENFSLKRQVPFFLKLRLPLMNSIVHGDFYVRHLLIDGNKELCGVIDWGDLHLGDRAIDLSVAHSFLPITAHEKFRKAYGEISEDTWSLSYLRAILSSSYFALYGYHSNDTVIMQEGLRSLKIMENTKF